MIGILGKIAAALPCGRLKRLESDLYFEKAKSRQLNASLRFISEDLLIHKKSLEEINQMMDKYADGLRVLGEAIEQLSMNNNEMVPKVLQLQTNQLQLARNLQRLTEVLMESDVIDRILPDFDRFH